MSVKGHATLSVLSSERASVYLYAFGRLIYLFVACQLVYLILCQIILSDMVL